MGVMTKHRRGQRHAGTGTRNQHWPLMFIAAPAAVAIWSGWVGLGGMAGFGIVHPLPGILPSVRINTAITLPVGVEAYGAYALWVWLSGRGTGRTLVFARRSAVGALALGCLGQVIFHLLTAAHWTEAPWLVVVAVACLPVVTLSFAATLVHLTRADSRAAEDAAAEKSEAEASELAALTAALEAESAARVAAETGRDDAQRKAEALARKLAAQAPRKRPRGSANPRTRKPAGTAAPEPAAVTPGPPAEPAPGTAPEPGAEETVDIDAENRILGAISSGQIDAESAILQLVENGRKPSKAGVLAGRSDSYGRQVVRKARELAAAAPKGQDPEG